MRFDVPLVSAALLGAAANAAAVYRPFVNHATDHQNHQIEQIEEEIEQLEKELATDLSELEHGQHPGQYRPQPYQPAGSSSSSLASSAAAGSSSEISTPASSVAQSSASDAATPSSSSLLTGAASSYLAGLTSSITLPSASSVATVNASSVLASLSSVAASLSSVKSSVSSVNATVTSTLATAYSSSIPGTAVTTVTQNSTVSSVPSGYSSVAPYTPASSSSDTCTDSSSTAASYASGASSSAIYSASSSSVVSDSRTSSFLSSSVAPASSASSIVVVIPSAVPTTSSQAGFFNSSSSPAAGTATTATTLVSVSPVASSNATSSLGTSVTSSSASASIVVSNNATSAFPTASGSSVVSISATGPSKIVSANSTSAFLTGTATMAPTPSVSVSSNITSSTTCSDLCSSLTFSSDLTVTPYTCTAYEAGVTVDVASGQSGVGCGTSYTPEVDLCVVTLEITTSSASSTYMEVWLPNGNTTSWNGRTMSTDNGGLNGCVAYDDMQYVSGMGFAAIGDNGGHNSSAYDGTFAYDNNEAVLDWAYRARHESVVAGKDVVKQFYGEEQSYAYYIGCSTGGQQGLHSAQYFPDDFDGIIAGSAAADFEHLEDWSARFLQLTGNTTSSSFLTEDQWIFVQSYIFDQCDEALDGVNDGIIEDPTICQFDPSVIPVCNGTSTDNCLTGDQVTTVYQIFTALYNTDGELLYPQLLYGSQVDAFRLGQLSGTVQGIAHDWFAYGVYNNSDFDVTQVDQADYAYADSLDAYHGYVSSFNGDLSSFRSGGSKMIMFHGMADPLVSGANSQRYYLKVANTLGIDNTEMDDFMRLFRISGMAHCGVGGISGAGAWMFGQSSEAALPGVADNIVTNLVNWVESNDAPDTITGTKFWYDEPSLGLEFERPHCRFPYRTTYESGDWTLPSSWGCTFIDDWQSCAVGAVPRLCNADGTFT